MSDSIMDSFYRVEDVIYCTMKSWSGERKKNSQTYTAATATVAAAIKMKINEHSKSGHTNVTNCMNGCGSNRKLHNEFDIIYQVIVRAVFCFVLCASAIS